MIRTVKPKKSLGQHFLTDMNVARRIAETMSEYKNLPLLEIGPGTGVLTQFLLQNEYDLTVVELDRESVEYLNEHFPRLRSRILEKDFLKLNLSDLYSEKFCVIGNYPYNISSQIFFKVLNYKDRIPCCSGMIQKEVAERMAARPGSKAYGILSVLLQAWYHIEYLFTVDETVFNPPPKVKSAVIRMTRNDVTQLRCNESLFKTIVKTGFNQRRKTLRNSLKPLFGKNCEICNDEIFGKRPEQLSVQTFIELTNRIEKYVISSH